MDFESSNAGVMSDTEPKMIRPRGYQLEMFDRSMKGNVIIAMDTGSGKTHIALLRIAAEIDRCPPGKRIWFLAPTVDLCGQQYNVICSYLPAIGTRLLVGSDGVDRWSEKRIWDAVLENIQIVVSTHAVLADALTHGFVNMLDLALLIFDEAHHCSRGHPANRIMFHYHSVRDKYGTKRLPHILGLSASPIARSKISELDKIESNLDSISVTPRVNRQELLKHVHRPILRRLEYVPCDPEADHIDSQALFCLKRICNNMSIPFQPVLPQPGQPAQAQPKKWKGTSLKTQLGSFCRKAVHIYEELGPWAANYFILESIAVLAKRHDSTSMFSIEELPDREALLRTLNSGPLLRLGQERATVRHFAISNKVEKLLCFLEKLDAEKSSGILFVRQRATVSVLCHLLSVHPRVKGQFQCATFVGTSNNAARKYSMAELLDLKAQSETLGEFRARKKNLIIATDVLEEGIDITACNLVFCFDPPPNVKSFIQRRGRARAQKSQFVIMFPDNEEGDKIAKWHRLEEQLIEAYQQEQREIKDLRNIEDETVEVVPGELVIESTGACITPDSTISHIHHFCACLPHEPYVDLSPTFSFAENPSTKRISATVTLPNSVISSVRSTQGLSTWKTEKAAAKDASFQAYKALHEAGLLNDHLLPLSRSWTEDVIPDEDAIAALINSRPQYNPWKPLADAWSEPDIHQTQIVLRGDKDEDLHITLITPAVIPAIDQINLFWDEETKLQLQFVPPVRTCLDDSATIPILRDITRLLMNSTSAPNGNRSVDYVALVSPNLAEDLFSAWHTANEGGTSAFEHYTARSIPSGVIRPSTKSRLPYRFVGWSDPLGEQQDDPEVHCVSLTRRRNFLNSRSFPQKFSLPVDREDDPHSPSSLQSFNIQDCTVDRLPYLYARFSLFIQPILEQVKCLMVAEKLRTTALKHVPIKDLQHIVTAISAPSAGLTTDYQRYEFFGDSVLKFFVSHQLFCEKENWHEGFLTKRKSYLVSNQKLAQAALSLKLDQFIMTEEAKIRKWKPPMITEVLQEPVKQRELSMKVLADVVEALIGAAYIDSGFDTARRCLNAFLPEIHIETPHTTRSLPSRENTSFIARAESIIGYEFKQKAILLEALTHPSYHDLNTESYQRLEFLGDSVLDMVLVRLLASIHETTVLTPAKMTWIKAALVNEGFLGFLCLDYGVESKRVVRIDEKAPGTFVKRVTNNSLSIWALMRHSTDRNITASQAACKARYEEYRDIIHEALTTGKSYPWLAIARLNLDKFYSDMIESIIGAIFIDSNGDLDTCEAFIRRIGLITVLERVIREDIEMRHPKILLGILADTKSVSYEEKRVQRQLSGSLEDRYVCTALVDNAEIATSGDCLSREEAVIAAAIEAVEILKLER
ncbi:hypothetical protein BT63DRAFT_267528 [Microthyrium microscopicum]|uniref:Dicer-like protein 2 n=1 Tax=Microthyrium microscopicum TaxID=703497 RepID=A0A6A6UFQ1_9PEZI|nr:hypothetical protein BT63DRAFT_267528 [Microthyrium microscopicum]